MRCRIIVPALVESWGGGRFDFRLLWLGYHLFPFHRFSNYYNLQHEIKLEHTSWLMQSLGIIILPLAALSGTLDAPWAMGSTRLCSATGFVLNIGGLAVPFYTLVLTHYFLQRVKYKKVDPGTICQENGMQDFYLHLALSCYWRLGSICKRIFQSWSRRIPLHDGWQTIVV